MDKRLSRTMTAHYALLQVLFNAVALAVFGFSSVFLRFHGLNDSQIGVILAVGTILNIIAQPIAGSLADRARKFSLNTLIAGFFTLVFAAGLLVMTATSVWMIAALFVLMHFAISMSESFAFSLAMEQVNRGVDLNFGLARGIGSVGYGIASLFLGRLIAQNTETVIMPYVAALCVLCVAALLPFGRTKGQSACQEAKEAPPPESMRGFIRENKRFCLFIVGIALMLYSYCTRASYMYQIILSIGGDVEQFGAISAFTAFVELPAMACYPLLAKRFKARSIVLFASVCFVLRTVILCFADSMAWVYLSQSMQMLSYALFVPSAVYYVNEVVGERNRNKGQTFLNAGQSTSSICASLLGGWMLTQAGGDPQNMLLISVAVSVVGLVILFWVHPEKR